MASIPAWFDYETYMANKLAQMQKTDPAGNWTVSKLVDVFAQNGFLGEDGAYEHFVQFGANEDVAPNADFNASEYYAAKAAQFYGVEPSAVTELQIANVKAIIAENGMNAWTHYVQYGSDEGVNPSNAFDADAYLDAKTAALVAAGEKQPDGSEWTPEAVQKAISDAGMTVLEHYMTYGGKGEGEVAQGVTFPVPDDQKVPSNNPGETFTLTTGIDTFIGGGGDDIFNATESEGHSTLTALDKLDGGAGEDTLNIVQTAAVDTTAAGATVTSMEKVNITSGGAVKTDTTTWGTKALNIAATGAVDATVADTTDVTATTSGANTTTILGGKAVSVTGGTGATSITGDGLTTVSVKGGGAVTIDNTLNAVSSTGTTMTSVILDGVDANSEIKGQGLTDVTVKGVTTAARTVEITNTKADHALTVNVDGTGYNASGTAQQTIVKDANATAITVNASGDKSSLALTGSTAATSLNITGDAALTLKASDLTALTTIDGSAATGDLNLGTLNAATVNVNTGSGDDTFSIMATAKVAVDAGAGDDTVTLGAAIAVGSTIKMGEGDDTIKVDTAPLTTEVGSIDGGAGDNDKLIFTDITYVTDLAHGAVFTGFEVLELSASTDKIFDTSLIAGIKSYGVGTSSANVTLSNILNNATTTVTGNVADEKSLTVALAVDTQNDTHTVVFDNGSSTAAAGVGLGGSAGGGLTVNLIEHLNFVSDGNANSANTIASLNADAYLKDITITGDQDFTIAKLANAVTTELTINGSAATGKLTIDASVAGSTAAININGGSANDTIKGGVHGGVINGGGGADAITLAAPSAEDILLYTQASDSTQSNMDIVTNFTHGEDKINIAALNLAQQAVLNAANVDLTAANLFADAGVVFDTNAKIAYIDANNDGVFTADGDMVIQLTGATIDANDFIFA